MCNLATWAVKEEGREKKILHRQKKLKTKGNREKKQHSIPTSGCSSS